MRKFTDEELLGCARRELKMRQHAYPRWVQARSNGMTKERADREIGMMTEIVDVLEERAAAERLPL